MKKSKKKLIGAIASAVVLLALIAGSVYLILNRDLLSSGSVVEVFDKIFNKEKNVGENAIMFDVYTDNVFAKTDGSLIVASGAGISMFSDSGTRLSSSASVIKKPRIAYGTKKALVWDSGSGSMTLSCADGMTDITASGAIIGVHMNNSDWFAVSAEESGYKASATVYNSDGQGVYKWYSGDGYLMDSAVSPNCQRMAAITLTDSGARLITFSLDSETIKGEYIEPDAVFLETEFLSDNRICVLSENSVEIFNNSADSIAVYDFSDEYLRDYVLASDGYAILLLSTYPTGSSARLVVLDAAGKETASLDIGKDVLSISAGGGNIAVAYADDSVAVYYKNLEQKTSATGLVGLQCATMGSNGEVYAVLSSEALPVN